jgi:hypothetical protein
MALKNRQFTCHDDLTIVLKVVASGLVNLCIAFFYGEFCIGSLICQVLPVSRHKLVSSLLVMVV